MNLNTSEGVTSFLKYVFLLALSAVFIFGYNYLTIEDAIFGADVSQDAIYHVDLQKNKIYELWVVDMGGPETIEVSISKDSYAPYGATFRLMHPEGDYLPYHPAFSVDENGTYDINVHPLDSGTVNVAILLRR